MDFQSGVLLLLIGIPLTIMVFSIIVWVESPHEKNNREKSEVQKSIDTLTNYK